MSEQRPKRDVSVLLLMTAVTVGSTLALVDLILPGAGGLYGAIIASGGMLCLLLWPVAAVVTWCRRLFRG